MSDTRRDRECSPAAAEVRLSSLLLGKPVLKGKTPELQEQFFEAYVENLTRFLQELPYPVHLFDAEGTSVMLNKAYLSMLGMTSAGRMVGRFNLFKDAFNQRMGLLPRLRKVFEGKVGVIPCIRIHVDDIDKRLGIERSHDYYVSHAYVPVVDPHGIVRYVVAFRNDLTEQILTQQRLQESEEKFKSVIEQSHDGVVIIDNTGTITDFNSAQAQMSGIAPSQALGTKIWDLQFQLVNPVMRTRSFLAQHRRMYREFFRTGVADWLGKVLQTDIYRADGSVLTIQSVIFPIRRGGETAYCSFNRDVTALRAVENELQLREAELREQNRLLHEKNIALREVMGQVDAEREKIARQIQVNIERLIMPIIARLQSRCTGDDRTYFNLLTENLRDITAEFGSVLDQRMHRLTQKEIELCDMIRRGLSTKEIAQLQYLSPRTIDTRRNRIRKKLGITDPEINLTTYLKGHMH